MSGISFRISRLLEENDDMITSQRKSQFSYCLQSKNNLNAFNLNYS